MTPPASRILVIDDNEDVLTALRLLFERRGIAVRTATSPASVPALLREERVDAVMLDMNFARDASSGEEGLMWLERILTLDPRAAVVMMTAYGDVELAVEAMKRGAVDFVTKPWQNERLLATVASAVRLRRAQADADRFRLHRDALGQAPVGQAPAGRFPDVVGQSAAIRRVLALVEKVGPTDATVLLLGENGTGKEVVARAIHQASARAAEAFVSVDLGALPESLFESELFGYAKGAFTGATDDRPGRFEAAEGGTLFLDEIGNVGLAQQAKLLSALQTRTVTRLGETQPRPVDIRVVAATNRPLRRLVAEGAFREDLLYRVNTVELHLPALRDRNEDVPLLAAHFLTQYAEKYDRRGLRLSPEALDAMQRHEWPGNVRELQHAVERAVVLAEGDVLEPPDLALTSPADAVAAGPAPPDAVRPPESSGTDTLELATVERALVLRALSKHGGNISRAADELGLSRKALYRRIEKHGL